MPIEEVSVDESEKTNYQKQRQKKYPDDLKLLRC